RRRDAGPPDGSCHGVGRRGQDHLDIHALRFDAGARARGCVMRIAMIPEPGRFEIADEPIPPIGPDDALVRVAACAVCASELDIWSGLSGHAMFPWYPGHEVSGVVERVGDLVQTVAPGDPVSVWVTTRGFAD